MNNLQDVMLIVIAVNIILILVQNVTGFILSRKVSKVKEELQESIDEVGDAIAVVDDDVVNLKRALTERKLIKENN